MFFGLAWLQLGGSVSAVDVASAAPTVMHSSCRDDVEANKAYENPDVNGLVDNIGKPVIQYCIDTDTHTIVLFNQFQETYVGLTLMEPAVSVTTDFNEVYGYHRGGTAGHLLSSPLADYSLPPQAYAFVRFDFSKLTHGWQGIVSARTDSSFSYALAHANAGLIPGYGYDADSGELSFTVEKLLNDEFFGIVEGGGELTLQLEDKHGVKVIYDGTQRVVVKSVAALAGLIDRYLLAKDIVTSAPTFFTLNNESVVEGPQMVAVNTQEYFLGPILPKEMDNWDGFAFSARYLEDKIAEIPPWGLHMFDYQTRTYQKLEDDTSYDCLINRGYTHIVPILGGDAQDFWGYSHGRDTNLRHARGKLFKGCYDASYSGKIVQFEDGKNYLIKNVNGNDEAQYIPYTETYNCLIAAGHQRIAGQTEEKFIRNNTGAGPEASCFDDSYWGGSILDFGGTYEYFIQAEDGVRKHYFIRDPLVRECLVGIGHKHIGSASLSYFVDHGFTHGNDASCFDEAKYGGKIIDFGTSAKYFIAVTEDGRKYHHIPDVETYNCLVGRGHTDIGTQSEDYITQYVGKSSAASCVDRSYWHGDIVTIEGASYYVRSDNTYQWLKWQGEHSCYVSRGSKVRTASRSYIDRYFTYTGRANPYCIDTNYYKNTVVEDNHSNASYYVDPAGVIQHIGSGSAYWCVRERAGVRVVGANELGYVLDGLTVRPGNVTCHTKAELAHDVVLVGSTYWFTHNNGNRYQMKDIYHESCFRARYGYVGRVATADLKKYTYNSTRITCYSINKYRNKIIRYPNGQINYVDGLGRERHLPNWARYSCMSRKLGRTYINVSDGYRAQLPNGPTINSCVENQYRNRIIRESSGRAWWIDHRGWRYWIPDGHTWNCFGGWGKVVNHVTPETVSSYHRRGHAARCYGGRLLNERLIRHSDGDAHFIDRNGNRHWIATGSAYWRYRNAYGNHIAVPRWLINSIHQSHHIY